MTVLLLVGKLGIWLVEGSYLPQLWRLYRLKEADEFSFFFPALNIAGRLCGLAVAVDAGSVLFSWFFVVGITLRAALLAQVIYYRGLARRRNGLSV